MKAIEILKHKWIQGNVVYDNDTEKHTRYLKYDDELMHEAIKELEELENRSCGNCKFCKDTYVINIGSHTCHNIKSWMNQSNIIKDFCCNKWENKQ